MYTNGSYLVTINLALRSIWIAFNKFIAFKCIVSNVVIQIRNWDTEMVIDKYAVKRVLGNYFIVYLRVKILVKCNRFQTFLLKNITNFNCYIASFNFDINLV